MILEIIMEIVMSLVFFISAYFVVEELSPNALLVRVILNAIGTIWAFAALFTIINRIRNRK